MSTKKKPCPSKVTAEERNRAIHAARLATWEKLMHALDTAEAVAEGLVDGVLDGLDAQDVMDHLADARARVLGARPRMVAWYGC